MPGTSLVSLMHRFPFGWYIGVQIGCRCGGFVFAGCLVPSAVCMHQRAITGICVVADWHVVHVTSDCSLLCCSAFCVGLWTFGVAIHTLIVCIFSFFVALMPLLWFVVFIEFLLFFNYFQFVFLVV